MNQLVLWIPRTAGDLCRHGERLACLRLGIIVGEIVDQLLHSDRTPRGKLSPVQKAADIAVRRRINVDGKSRKRILDRRMKFVFVNPVEGAKFVEDFLLKRSKTLL